MPKCRSGRSKKRRFHGNRFLSDNVSASSKPIEVTASTSKLLMNDSFCDLGGGNNNDEELSGNRINISVLKTVLSLLCCPDCLYPELLLTEESVFGLCSHFVLSCKKCSFRNKFASSDKTGRSSDINSRLVLGMRLLGKGSSGAKKMCATLDLPPPPYNVAYKNQQKKLYAAVLSVAKNSINEAANEVKEINYARNDDNDVVECGVSVDGTWQRRGYSSLNGCVAVLSIDTGKILDIELMSQYCSVCNKLKRMEKNVAHDLLKAEHECNCNYKGSASGMEQIGAYRIFERSTSKHSLKYTEYYGDGDSKSFSTIKDIYGKDSVVKLECIGHVQKRVGSRLRKLKSRTPGLGGKGKLTDRFIDKLQNYYGIAIRSNVGNLSQMQQAVIASLFHCCSSSKSPMHGQCPLGPTSWCKYQRATADGKILKEKSPGIPAKILNIVKPIYMELCKQHLLQKCLHRKTQNANEYFNGILWQMIPKNTFVTLKTMQFGAYLSLIQFNDGFAGLLKVFNVLGIKPGFHTVKGYEKLDKIRICDSMRHSSSFAKKQRKKLKAISKKKLVATEQTEGVCYKAGEF